MTAIVPAGVCPQHIATRIDAIPAVAVKGLRTVVDIGSIVSDVSSAQDLSERGMASFDGDQRWVALTTIALVEAADQVLTAGEQDDNSAIALLRHLNPHARIGHRLVELAGVCTYDRGRPASPHTDCSSPPTAQPAAGYRSSVHHLPDRLHPHRLQDAVEHVATKVIRADGCLRLATQPSALMRLHVSAGMASLDPVPTDTNPSRQPGRLTITTSGLSQRDHDRLFTPFQQATWEPNSTPGGGPQI
ncbi:MAG: GTP-binding protein [Actinobacteria bacterium]|nr:GTP-binding protein [Actinomycetota bacterium]